MTLDNFFQIWINDIRTTVKPNTIRTYRCAYKNHIAAELGSHELATINHTDIINARTVISQSVSAGYTNYVITVLKMMLEEALRREIIDKNPAGSIRSIKVIQKSPHTTHRALTVEEQQRFMFQIKGKKYYNLIALLLCTGLRFGEAGALRWTDIDFTRGVISVNRTISYDESCHTIIEKTPKSQASVREIPINSTIRAILLSQKELTYGLGKDKNPDNLIFLSGKNTHPENRSVNRFISKAVSEINASGFEMEKFTCHALRDTFATRYIEQGGTMQTLKTLLGHSSITLTMDLYSHVLPDIRKKEMDMISIDIG